MTAPGAGSARRRHGALRLPHGASPESATSGREGDGRGAALELERRVGAEAVGSGQLPRNAGGDQQRPAR